MHNCKHKIATFFHKEKTKVIFSVLALIILTPILGLSLENSLLGRWTFDDTKYGVAEDSSGNGRHAKVYGATQTEGHLSGALMFDGHDDYIELGDLGEHKSATIAFWIKTQGIDSRERVSLISSDVWEEGSLRVILKNEIVSAYLHMGTGSNGKLRSGLLVSQKLLDYGEWYHVAIVVNTEIGIFKLFTNGIDVDMDDIIRFLGRIKLNKQVVGKALAAIGSSSYFRGSIDDVRVYDKALSTAEIRKLCPDAPPIYYDYRSRNAWHVPQSRQPPVGSNLARGKLCAFRPHPNYSPCTGRPGDASDLTDGLFNNWRWTTKGTVGWAVGRTPVFSIFVDLGAEYPIGRIVFDSSTNLKTDLAFPAGVLLFVSTDGQHYNFLGDVLTEFLPQGNFKNYRFDSGNLKGWGRYVRFVIIPGGHFVFSDEIEILKGAHTREQARQLNIKPIPANEVNKFAMQMVGPVHRKNTTLALLHEAEDAVKVRSKILGNGNIIKAALNQLDKERSEFLSEKLSTEADYSQGPPYREWDRRAFQVVAELNARIWPGQPVVIWQKSDWEWLRPLEAPVDRETGAQVSVDMMKNEWATSGFIVTSASEKTVELSLSAEDFRGPETVSADRLMRISHVVHAESVGYTYRDDPIVPLEKGVVMLQPGVSKRIWLTFKTRSMDLKAGIYNSKVDISVDGEQVSSIPVRLHIWPMRFPDDVTLHSNTWAYFYEPGLAGNEDAAAQDLLDHYNTTLVINHFYLPHLKADAQGNLEPLDFSKMDKLLEWNPKVRLWLISPGFEFRGYKIGKHKFGTIEWERAFSQYVIQMRDYLGKKRVNRRQFAWYWTDEPEDREWEKYDLPVSKMLKKIDPQMLVWANPSDLNDRQIKSSLPYVDIFCLSNPSQVILDVIQNTNLKSWLYVCASGKNKDPFIYYRSLAWKAWKNNLGGIGMWVYADLKNQTFSDYVYDDLKRPKVASYALIYKGNKAPIDSKRWAAWRQGIADYEYLTMIYSAVSDAEVCVKKKDACRRGKMLLSQGVNKVIETINSNSSSINKSNITDSFRIKILQCLAELHSQAMQK